MESIVFAIETLRRLECRFAVARFGDRGAVMKNFDQPFNAAVGEQILSLITHDEGSHPCTGLAGVARHLWSHPKAANTHRCVIMITDGLSKELSDDTGGHSFLDLRKQYKFWLSVVQIGGIKVSGTNRFENALRIATSGMVAKVDGNSADNLIEQLLKAISLVYVVRALRCSLHVVGLLTNSCCIRHIFRGAQVLGRA